jgi:hypothetical protein
MGQHLYEGLQSAYVFEYSQYFWLTMCALLKLFDRRSPNAVTSELAGIKDELHRCHLHLLSNFALHGAKRGELIQGGQ